MIKEFPDDIGGARTAPGVLCRDARTIEELDGVELRSRELSFIESIVIGGHWSQFSRN
jgi:hypothetical protein